MVALEAEGKCAVLRKFRVRKNRFYVEKKIFPDDSFQTLDQEGVGELLEIGVKRGRSTRGDLKVGICCEHGGDPESVTFCHKVGLNYVSCSPYRVPISLLAAAHAALADQVGATAVVTTAYSKIQPAIVECCLESFSNLRAAFAVRELVEPRRMRPQGDIHAPYRKFLLPPTAKNLSILIILFVGWIAEEF